MHFANFYIISCRNPYFLISEKLYTDKEGPFPALCPANASRTGRAGACGSSAQAIPSTLSQRDPLGAFLFHREEISYEIKKLHFFYLKYSSLFNPQFSNDPAHRNNICVQCAADPDPVRLVHGIYNISISHIKPDMSFI